jgi:hypothetical protein
MLAIGKTLQIVCIQIIHSNCLKSQRSLLEIFQDLNNKLEFNPLVGYISITHAPLQPNLIEAPKSLSAFADCKECGVLETLSSKYLLIRNSIEQVKQILRIHGMVASTRAKERINVL